MVLGYFRSPSFRTWQSKQELPDSKNMVYLRVCAYFLTYLPFRAHVRKQ